LQKGATKGHSHTTFGAAALYIACNQRGFPRSLNEICLSADLEKKKVTKCFRKMMKSLGIRITSTEAKNFSNRFVDQLGLDPAASRQVALLANHIGTAAKEMGIVEGRNPTSTTSAAIWMAVQAKGQAPNTTKENISKSSQVAVTTIRDTYRDMYPVRNYLLAGKMDAGNLHLVKEWGTSKKIGLMDKAVKWAKKTGLTPLGAKQEPIFGDDGAAAAAAAGGGGGVAAAAGGIKQDPG